MIPRGGRRRGEEEKQKGEEEQVDGEEEEKQLHMTCITTRH